MNHPIALILMSTLFVVFAAFGPNGIIAEDEYDNPDNHESTAPVDTSTTKSDDFHLFVVCLYVCCVIYICCSRIRIGIVNRMEGNGI